MKVGDVIDVLGGIPDRLALQKTVYLLQKMGLDFGYHFKWYTLGPFSADLSNDMLEGLSISAFTTIDGGYNEFKTGKTYDILRKKISFSITKETEQIKKLEEVLGEDLKDSAMLECIGSLLYLIKDRWPKIESKNEAFSELENLKPKKFKKSMKAKSWDYLRNLGF